MTGSDGRPVIAVLGAGKIGEALRPMYVDYLEEHADA